MPFGDQPELEKAERMPGEADYSPGAYFPELLQRSLEEKDELLKRRETIMKQARDLQNTEELLVASHEKAFELFRGELKELARKRAEIETAANKTDLELEMLATKIAILQKLCERAG
ncbi:MAG: hypothetical protein ACM3TT_01810 [Syntrophothermus sp.]